MKLPPNILVLPILVIAVACGSAPKRNPVPFEHLEVAAIPGMPNVRNFGDADPDRELTLERMRVLRSDLAAGDPNGDPNGAPVIHWLAMSGGAADGAFGAGLLCGWTEAGTRPVFQSVSGVSTGALAAPFVFLGSDYDGQLERFYTEGSADQIMEKKSVFSILGSSSIAKVTPLRELLEELIDLEFMAEVAREHKRGRRLLISTTNLDADRPVLWDLGRIARQGTPEALRLFHDVLIASASVPGLFPPVLFEVEAGGQRYDELHVDGGVQNQVTLLPAAFEVREALQEVGLDPRIELYVIRNRPVTPEYAPVEAKIIDILGRSMSSTTRAQGIGDLYRMYLACVRDGIEFRLAAIPPDFKHPREEEFDTEYMRALFACGHALGSDDYEWASTPPGFEPGQVVAGDG